MAGLLGPSTETLELAERLAAALERCADGLEEYNRRERLRTGIE